MDAFKSLSRPAASSHKKPKGAAFTVQATSAPLPQVTQAQDTAQSVQSRKRKRGAQATSELPHELDFFSQDREAVDETTNHARIASLESHVENTGRDSKIINPPLLPENACRRILREHKLKITRLDVEEEIIDTTKSKKKRRKQQEADQEAKRREKKQRKHNLDVVPQPLLDLAQLRLRHNVNPRLAANVLEQGYTKPTEVQIAALPLLLDSAGNTVSDLLTVAPTGSGKTLAFLIPLIDGLLSGGVSSPPGNPSDGPRAVIVSPTKELAIQTVHEAEKLTKGTGLRVALARKRMSLGLNIDIVSRDLSSSDSEHEVSDSPDESLPPQQSRASADIIICTPLTLVNALISKDGTPKALPEVRNLVLDEADVLLDPLFEKQTLQIWSACTNPSLRVSLWSATMGASVEDVARDTIADRVKQLSAKTSPQPTTHAPLLRLIVGLKDSAIPHIAHRLTYCGNESGKLLALRQLLRPSSNGSTTAETGPPLRPPFLVFTQTIARARALYSELLYDIPVSAGGSTRIAVLHAELTSRIRANIMARARKGEVWVLITTDLLSRGVDFKGVNGVVNYDFPSSSAAYVHRVGRTGRAGREGGVAVTLYDKDDMPFVKNVANVIAAARRARGGGGAGVGDGEGERDEQECGVEKWLLESLPKPSKRDRQRLKKRGIESRRPVKFEGGKAAKVRIGTKSGFERRAENKKKGAVAGSKRRARAPSRADNSGDESGFDGFD